MLFGHRAMVGADRNISYARAVREAAQQYERCYERGLRRRVFRRLLGRPSSLTVPKCRRGGAAPRTGTGSDVLDAVTIDRIRGSETHCGEFDDRFHPLARTRNRDRWITIAANLLLGNAVPTATLVMIEKELYVRSGHDAISVARAAGQTAVDVRIVYLTDDTSRHTEGSAGRSEETTAPDSPGRLASAPIGAGGDA